MGLDLAEMVMDTEDAFGIELSEEDLAEVRTVGELVAVVSHKLECEGHRACYCGEAFRRLRDAFSGVVDGDERLRPSTRLRDLFAPEEESRVFVRLRRVMGDTGRALPEASAFRIHPARTHVDAVSSIIGLAGLAVFFYGVWTATVSLAALGVVLALVAENVQYHSERGPGSFFREPRFPDWCETLGDVARVLSARMTPDAMDGARPLRTEVESRVRSIVAGIIDAPPHTVGSDQRFVEDLGMG